MFKLSDGRDYIMYLFLESSNWFPCDIWVVSYSRMMLKMVFDFLLQVYLGKYFMFLPILFFLLLKKLFTKRRRVYRHNTVKICWALRRDLSFGAGCSVFLKKWYFMRISYSNIPNKIWYSEKLILCQATLSFGELDEHV